MADSSGLSDIVKRAAQANAKFYKGWMDLSLEYVRGISEIFGGVAESMGPVQEMDAGNGALVLEGEAGSQVRGSFLVSNDLERQASCKFIGSDFKDPHGASVLAPVVFDPAGLELGPGEERVIQVAILIDEAFVPGVGYAGEISIGGMEGFAVPVVLRRLHRVDDGSIDQKPVNRTTTARPTTPVNPTRREDTTAAKPPQSSARNARKKKSAARNTRR